MVNIYIDPEDMTKNNRDYELDAAEFYGQVEIRGPWQPGFDQPKIIHAPSQVR